MNKIEINNNRNEMLTTESIEIPGFGDLEIIPSINGHACAEPGESKDFTKEEIDKAMINMHIKRVSQNEGAEKSLGGSFGPTMALLGSGIEITPGQAVDLVNEWELSEGRKFTFYQYSQVKGFGCSHVVKAKENPELYGLTKEKVASMMRHVANKLIKEEMIAEVPVLLGHDETKGVLVVLTNENDPKTVRSTDNKRNEFIRLDATLHDKRLGRLSDFAAEKGFNIEKRALLESAKKQRNATLGLTAEGLPIFIVNLQGGKPFTSKIGPVRPLPKKA